MISPVRLVNDGQGPLSGSCAGPEGREPRFAGSPDAGRLVKLSTPASRPAPAGLFALSSASSRWLGAVAVSRLSDPGAWRADHGVNTESVRLIGRESAGHAPDGLAAVGTLAGTLGRPASSEGNVPDGLSERGGSACELSPPGVCG
jgi:hypothetical protein